MKKLFTISSFLVLSAILLAGCSKRGVIYDDHDDYNYWLSKENGVVVYSDGYCPYYVVETYNGYTIIRATGGYTPIEGDEIYGDLSRRGYKDLYNYSNDAIIRGEVTDYWLSYEEAQYIIDNTCYAYNKTSSPSPKKAITKGLLKKK
jgi:hypothetical protein